MAHAARGRGAEPQAIRLLVRQGTRPRRHGSPTHGRHQVAQRLRRQDRQPQGRPARSGRAVPDRRDVGRHLPAQFAQSGPAGRAASHLPSDRRLHRHDRRLPRVPEAAQRARDEAGGGEHARRQGRILRLAGHRHHGCRLACAPSTGSPADRRRSRVRRGVSGCGRYRPGLQHKHGATVRPDQEGSGGGQVQPDEDRTPGVDAWGIPPAQARRQAVQARCNLRPALISQGHGLVDTRAQPQAQRLVAGGLDQPRRFGSDAAGPVGLRRRTQRLSSGLPATASCARPCWSVPRAS